MSIYINKKKIIDETDWQNTNAGTNLVKDVQILDSRSQPTGIGTIKDFTGVAQPNNDWNFWEIPLNISFKRNDVFTVSAFATLTGPKAADGLYEVTIFNQDTSASYDPTADTVFLKSGQRSSKTIKVNADSDPNKPPMLVIYSGKRGSTAGNTIHVQNIKLERGSVATQWSPAPEDLVLKSEFDSLKEKVDSLTKSVNGGGNSSPTN